MDVSEWLTKLEEITIIDSEAFRNSLKNCKIQYDVDAYMVKLSDIKSLAVQLSSLSGQIMTFSSTDREHFFTSVNVFLDLFQNIELNLSNSSFVLISFSSCLNALNSMFNSVTKTFDSKKVTMKDALDALDEYTSHAAAIRFNDSFKNSPFDTLEKMLVSKQSVCERLFEKIHSKKKFSTETAFIALAAPSLDGKTQSAFVLNEVKPLYFSFSGGFSSSHRKPQPIYTNYNDLSVTLKDLAEKDIEGIGKYIKSKYLPESSSIPDKDMRISATFLSENLSISSWSLGFLKALANHMRIEAAKNPKMTWMELLAGDLRFWYAPLSIQECRLNNYFSGVCLFLDEFVSDDWTTLLRNLARVINLNCLVANTNSRIANILGTGDSSGTAGELIWSIVFTKLNSAELDFLNRKYHLADNISAILNHRGTGAANDPVGAFLEMLTRCLIRPGVAIILSKALNDFARDLLHTLPRQFPLGVLADFVCEALAAGFVERKPSMVQSVDGRLAKTVLSVPETFESITASLSQLLEESSEDDFKLDQKKLCNKANYLKEHLYYLNNPQDASSDIFLTFGPAAKPSSSLFQGSSFKDRPPRKLRVFCDENMCDWNMELSHFKECDFSTLLGCFFVPLMDSIAYLYMSTSLKSKSTSEGGSTNVLNDALKSSNSGNELETSTSSIIIESTRHSHVERKYSFNGQDGLEFVKNVVRNMVLNFKPQQDYTMPAAYNVNIGLPPAACGFNLNSFLLSCRIPFIYGMKSFEDLENLSSFDEKFYVAKLTRCANKAEIDASVPFKQKQLNGSFSDALMSVECKNYYGKVDCSLLCSILEKALKKPDCRLSIVFANSCSGSSKPFQDDPDASALTEFCDNSKINLYRVAKSASMNFEIVRFESKLKINHDPKMVCLIFEVDLINVTQDKSFFEKRMESSKMLE